MYIKYIVMGAIVGLLLGASGTVVTGMLAGCGLAYLWARQNDLITERAWLKKQIQSLQDQIQQKAPAATGTAHRTAEDVAAEPVAPAASPEPNTSFERAAMLSAKDEPAAVPEPVAPAVPQRAAKEMPEPALTRASQPTPAPAAAGVSKPKPTPAQPASQWSEIANQPDPFDKLVAAGKRWLTTGNVPVKLGIIVSFFGVGFLLKYAVDIGLLRLSLEMRYMLVALSAIGLFAFAWRLREKMRVYSLSLQGGAIGILFLTVFAAYRLHPILPAPLALLLLVALAVILGGLAIIESSLTLAVLGTVGGFLSPILMASSGNHVGLFGYYLILNAAILGIAWHKSWRILNLIGFGFTFVVASMWGAQYYRPEYFATTEPFLIAFFIFYQAIAILYAFRQPPNLRGLVDGTLIFGTPGIAFALQAALLKDSEYGLAISAALVAVMYAGTALALHRLKIDKMRLLIESFISLSTAFATLAIPLALDDRWTALAWTLEGAALVWVGVKQSRLLSKYTGIALLFGSGFAFMSAGWDQGLGMPILNGNVISGLLIGLLSLMSAYRLAMDSKKVPGQYEASITLLIWGVAWWLGTGIMEIIDRVDGRAELHYMTTYLALTVAALSLVAQRLKWRDVQQLTLAFLPGLGVVALMYLDKFHHLLAGPGLLVWGLAFAVHFIVLRRSEDTNKSTGAVWHYAGAMLLAAALTQDVFWRVAQFADNKVWASSSAMFLMTALGVGLVYARQYISWPLQQHESTYNKVSITLVAAQIAFITLASLIGPGDPSPLPYLPLLNPYDALTVLGLAIAFYSLQPGRLMTRILSADQLRTALINWGIAAFLLSTIALVRGVHFIADVPWRDHQLMSSVAVQSSLSIYWAILGLSGMILGTRRAQRTVWIVGAGLMVVVVGKLFLIDLGNTGTIARIISFLGVGGMLLVVGYFSPAPPRLSEDVSAETESSA